MDFDQVKLAKLSQYKKLLKQKVTECAFQYLTSQIKNKGKEIIYEQIKMAEYLLPNDVLSIEDQKLIFSLRSQSFQIIDEDSKITIENCICSAKLDILHLYACTELNEDTICVNFDNIYNDKISEKKIIVTRIRQSLQNLQNVINDKT